MRRAVIFIILLAVSFGIAFTVFYAYSNHTSKLERTDFVYDELTLHSNGDVSGKFLCEKSGRKISGYTYSVSDGNLYITLYVTAGEKKALETDKDGYYHLLLEDVGKVNKIYYADSEKDHVLSFNED